MCWRNWGGNFCSCWNTTPLSFSIDSPNFQMKGELVVNYFIFAICRILDLVRWRIPKALLQLVFLLRCNTKRLGHCCRKFRHEMMNVMKESFGILLCFVAWFTMSWVWWTGIIANRIEECTDGKRLIYSWWNSGKPALDDCCLLGS